MRSFPLSRLWRAAAATLLAGTAATALAAAPTGEWPRQPITLIMGFPAGSGVDVVARVLQEPLSAKLGQPIIIDYRAGAAGNIASEHVARANPDGYTLVFGTAATHGSNAAIYPNLPFDVEADFVPVAPVLDVSNVLTINPDVIDVKDLQGFVDTVRANPGKYNFASTGNGAGTHMAFAEFNSRLGLNMIHVPYKGGPEAILSVVRGETCCIMNQVQTVLPHAQAGRVRLLGVTTAEPVPAVKDVPPIAASGIAGTEGFDSAIWFGIFAPKGTDPAIAQRINAAVRETLEDPAIRARYEQQGNTIRLETPEQFRETVHADRIKWADIAKKANIRID
ncbi:tripartite tricarboxylate transporter substrate binding protein [Achromobacter sp. GG226]|uniref:Bug family tripartite tricarboxylate transporter substrate binding protein n=1 Tax=Verticiella alkaliphila TaxID=2779529 RepID=UPI001C0E306B|nr:tripartite tricarboxylate transporter substrate binding protein [Verticiella sp. GG226]MBU4612131.1 tripartite tricarboxylate transporter substrate binding protein [Verticiella sp. GG226]